MSKKILVVSDTHGRNENLKFVLNKEKPDIVYHLGDSELTYQELSEIIRVPFEVVRGNCDYAYELPMQLVLPLGKHRLFLCHGHRHAVRVDLSTLREAAKQNDCDIALYGHNHIPDIDYNCGMICASPGSISEPRQRLRRLHTYLILTVDDEGEIKLDMKAVEEIS